MITLALTAMLILSPAGSPALPGGGLETPASEGELQPMPVDIARVRIEQGIDAGATRKDRVLALREVMARCDDPAMISLAAYNLGTMFIETGEDDRLYEAIEAFRAADRTGASARVRAKARFNIGHARYRLAHLEENEDAGQQDQRQQMEALRARIDLLLPAAGAFRSVVEIEPEHAQAAENVELVRREMKQLREQIAEFERMLEQQRQEQQQRQQQQQQAADQLEQLAEQQQQQALQSAQNPPETDEQREQQSQNQEQLSEQTQEAREDVAAQQAPPEQEQQKTQIEQKLQEAREAQQRAEQAMEQGDQQQAAQEQQRAAEALQEAAEQMQQMSEQTGEQGQEGQRGQQGQPGEGEQGLGEQQAEGESEPKDGQGDQISELARQLLEKERRERERRDTYRARGRPTQVEKDW